MKFDNHKYEEMALMLLMVNLQKELIEQNTKSFEDGIKFGWLGTELLTIYRYKKAKESKIEKLSKVQDDILTKGLQFIKDLNIPEEWFDREWLSENYLNVLNFGLRGENNENIYTSK